MRPAVFEHPGLDQHVLLDSGEEEKLERFGRFVLRRPDPQALWRRRLPARDWRAADLSFVRESDRGGRWERGGGKVPDEWPIRIRGAEVIVRPTPFKHVGVFPEQAANWDWVGSLAGSFGVVRPRLLNLFGYTGVASVLAARAGYAVTHVDASKASVAWTRENVGAAGLAPDVMRILVEDAAGFAGREARRGARYEGILLDPPHYGRGPKGEKWQFELGIAPLLAACAQLLAERSFLVLSSYAIGTSPLAFTNLLGELEGGSVEAGELALPEDGSSRRLPCGFCARWTRGLP